MFVLLKTEVGDIMALFQIEGEELIEKEVGKQGEMGRIYLHKKYIGQLVKIVILKKEISGNNGSGGRDVVVDVGMGMCGDGENGKGV